MNNWFKSNDLGVVKNNILTFLGRKTHLIKVLGENVNLLDLEKILTNEFLNLNLKPDFKLFTQTDKRLGEKICLKTTKTIKPNLTTLLKNFHNKTMPFERIHQIEYVDQLKKSSIGKIL